MEEVKCVYLQLQIFIIIINNYIIINNNYKDNIHNYFSIFHFSFQIFSLSLFLSLSSLCVGGVGDDACSVGDTQAAWHYGTVARVRCGGAEGRCGFCGSAVHLLHH